jgi:hypothetical protein
LEKHHAPPTKVQRHASIVIISAVKGFKTGGKPLTPCLVVLNTLGTEDSEIESSQTETTRC